MNKLAIVALATASLLLAACDEASTENINSNMERVKESAGQLKNEADRAASGLMDSAKSQWQQTKEQAGDMADANVSQLLPDSANEQLERAKSTVTEMSDLKISDLLSGENEENQADEEGEGEEN